jgi:multicomponent Na+:H+ antiporter subunit G
MRLACTAKSATVGLGLLLCGLAWFFSELDITSRALATIFFLLFTTPVATHRIARVAYLDGIRLWEGTFLDELKGRYDAERNLASGQDPHAKNRH